MASRIENLTGNTVVVFDENGQKVAVFQSDGLAQVTEAVVKETVRMVKSPFNDEDAFHVGMQSLRYGKVSGLPEVPAYDTVYVVSRPVAEAIAPDTFNVVVPYPLVRDEDGRVIGCRGFAEIGR